MNFKFDFASFVRISSANNRLGEKYTLRISLSLSFSFNKQVSKGEVETLELEKKSHDAKGK
jgi:hypothetical protein